MTNPATHSVDPAAVAAALDGADDGAPPSAPTSPDPFDDMGPSELRDVDPSIDMAAVEACAVLDHSDTDNGKRLLAHFGRDLAVVAQENVAGGDWAGWTGKFWDMAGGVALSARIAQTLGARIALEADFLQPTPEEDRAIKAAREFAKVDDSDEAKNARALADKARKSWDARKAARWRFAVTSKNAGRMENTLKCAAPHIRRDADKFNADPLKVATATHTLRFRRTSEPDPDTDGRTNLWTIEAVKGHVREDYITAIVPFAWRGADEPATLSLEDRARELSPKWHAFLNRMLPDADKRRTVRAYSGIGLLNQTPQRLMYHYGLGANGKSVFLETLTRVLGDSFAIGLPPESITGEGQRSAGGASPDIARLFGKRMVRVLELPEGKPLHEDLVKRLTGGEKFPVRSLFKGYFEFVNRATPHMSGNGFPTIDGTDHGIWRRLLVVHWDQTIPEGERREFEEVVGELVDEGSGILLWLAVGALDFLQGGLPIAPSIAAATEDYRSDMDPIGEFAKECVVTAPGRSVTASAMYQAYVSWSEANARRARTATKFGKVMPTHFQRTKRSGVMTYVDCDLHDVPARPERAGAGDYPEGYDQ